MFLNLWCHTGGHDAVEQLDRDGCPLMGSPESDLSWELETVKIFQGGKLWDVTLGAVVALHKTSSYLLWDESRVPF